MQGDEVSEKCGGLDRVKARDLIVGYLSQSHPLYTGPGVQTTNTNASISSHYMHTIVLSVQVWRKFEREKYANVLCCGKEDYERKGATAHIDEKNIR